MAWAIMTHEQGNERAMKRGWPLLLAPVIGLLWVPFYDRRGPALFGFPFFYWYQFAWIPVTAVLIRLAWALERRA